MSVSAIVSNLNGGKYLHRLLATLRAQRHVELQIIVVDRHSTDDSAAILNAEPGVTVLHHAPETGLAAGYHAGAQAATGEHLFFCNEDMWFDEDCLWQLERQINLSARVAVADPWQWTYDGTAWLHGGVRFERCPFTMLSPYPFRRMNFTEDLPAGTEIPFACAGAMLIHRDVYQQIGGWDASFFLDLEDVDLSIRLWQRGWKTVTVPDAKVFHAVNASNLHTLVAAQETVSRRRYISGPRPPRRARPVRPRGGQEPRAPEVLAPDVGCRNRGPDRDPRERRMAISTRARCAKPQDARTDLVHE